MTASRPNVTVASSVRLSVCSFVRSSVTNLWTLYFKNEWTEFNANWQKSSPGQGHDGRPRGPGGQRSRSQECILSVLCAPLIFFARQHTDARYWYSTSVCPSVRPSVCLSVSYVPVFHENGLTYCHSFFTTRQPNHSSFMSIKHLHEMSTGRPWGGAKYTGGV